VCLSGTATVYVAALKDIAAASAADNNGASTC
jgi:hypothetical protein